MFASFVERHVNDLSKLHEPPAPWTVTTHDADHVKGTGNTKAGKLRRRRGTKAPSVRAAYALREKTSQEETSILEDAPSEVVVAAGVSYESAGASIAPVASMHTNKSSFASSIFATLAACLVMACASDSNREAVSGSGDNRTGVTSAQMAADMAVVDRLSGGRCDQEQRCKNIGPDAKYASRPVCLDRIHEGLGNDLNAYRCPRGLDSAGVDRCMDAIKGEECGHPFETLSRYDTCRSSAMCMK